jgi:hypothetical protein
LKIFTTVEKITIQWTKLSNFQTTDPWYCIDTPYISTLSRFNNPCFCMNTSNVKNNNTASACLRLTARNKQHLLFNFPFFALSVIKSPTASILC